MAYSKALNEATKRWVKANREKITFTTEKGFNNRLKECAKKMGMSKQKFIIETLKRETGKMTPIVVTPYIDSLGLKR